MENAACLESVSYDSDQRNPNISAELDSLPLPPFDFEFFSDDLTLSEDLLIELGFNNDFDYSLDDLPELNENGNLLVEDGSKEVFSSSVSVDLTGAPSPCQDSAGMNGSGELCVSSSSQMSGDQSSYVDKFLNSPSPNSGSCEEEFSGPVSFHDSGYCRSASPGVFNSMSPDSSGCGSGANEVVRSPSPSPDFGCCDRDFTGSATSSPNCGKISSHVAPDQIIKLEEGKGCLTKRKQEKEDGNFNARSKLQKSTPLNNANPPYAFNVGNEEEDKRKARLMRNRESAQLSRQKKKHYVEELEDKVRSMHSTITELNSKISYIMAENAGLRQQFGGGVCPPPPGIYPPPSVAPMPYPWVPSYTLRPQGSQIPLVPIPKLKPQQPLSSSKNKKSESKKSEGRTKKVASVSFLGFLFFILLFGGLVPFVNLRSGVSRDTVLSGSDASSNGFNVQSSGRVLTVNGHVNRTSKGVGVGMFTGNFSFEKGVSKITRCKRGMTERGKSEAKQNERRKLASTDTDWFVRVGNATEPLVASLHVPRNDKLVRIDGNLIIHSVLASEKAMASSHAETGPKKDKTTVASHREVRGTDLAIPANMVPVLDAKRHPHLFRSQSEQQKALTSSAVDTHKDTLKSSAVDGSLQQWFREGLAGPMLSSGMCTEVFQFNANVDAIIPATPVSNISTEQKNRNRRILVHPSIPLSESTFNKTEEHFEETSQKDNFQGNKSVSSMVVSILVDPREKDNDSVIKSTSLSRIFVVVLVDSVKYVTYSCVLPLKGSNPHLVTT